MSKLSVGMQLPNFEFKTSTGAVRSVAADVTGKRTVFWVIRYIGCTICRYDVHVLAQKYAELQEKGVQLFVVMQSDPAIVQEELKDAGIPFDIVCDPEMAIYKQFEILPAADMKAMAGTPEQLERLQAKGKAAAEAGFSHGKYEGDELQLPAVWVVEADGTLSYVKYGEAVADIPTPDELIAML